jgi:hypothetical protein
MWYCLPALELNAGFLDNDSAYKPDPGEKTFSPSSPKAGLSFLFRLSEPRFAYSLKITPVSCLAHARFISEPTDVLRSESAVCGLNGHGISFVISLFKATYKLTIQVSRNFHALFTKTLREYRYLRLMRASAVAVLRRMDLGPEACRDLLHYARGRLGRTPYARDGRV